MNPVCKEEFKKAKNLIKLRIDDIGSHIKPDIQNLDSGIFLQFFENWEDIVKVYNGTKIGIKRRVFDVLNKENIEDVIMYFANDFEVKSFELEYDVLYINLDGSFDFIVDGEIIHMKPFSVVSFMKGTKLEIQNFDDVNYLISIKFKSPLF